MFGIYYYLKNTKNTHELVFVLKKKELTLHGFVTEIYVI